MSGGERWQMLRCGERPAQDNTVIDRIMLRFRPIAPKPAAGESSSGGTQFDNKNLLLSKTRSKRKYVRVRKSSPQGRGKGKSSDQEQNCDEKIVTLQLFPEKDESNDSNCQLNRTGCVTNSGVNQEYEQSSSWFSLMSVEPDLTVLMHQSRVVKVESWVMVESVTDTFGEERELRVTDVERMRNLEADTCPGFISDGLNRVPWVNGAYKKMVVGSEAENGTVIPEVTVKLVWKEEAPWWCTAFSCSVRLQYAWQKEKRLRSVPCDAWRMDGGGFAWRLDVEAALSLGR